MHAINLYSNINGRIEQRTKWKRDMRYFNLVLRRYDMWVVVTRTNCKCSILCLHDIPKATTTTSIQIAVKMTTLLSERFMLAS